MGEETNNIELERTTKTGLEIFETAILLGILGDVLLRSTPLGLNVLLWMTVFAAAIIGLKIRRRVELKNKWLFAPLIIFSAFFAWRDSAVLMLLDVFAILLTLALMTLQNQNIAVRLAGTIQYFVGFLTVLFNSAFAPLCLLFNDIQWAKIPRKKWMNKLVPVLRGLAIAVPIVVIFGALLTAADAAFDNIVRQTFNIQPEILLMHGFVIGVVVWTTAGVLRGLFLQGKFGEVHSDAQTNVKTANAPNYEEPKAQSYVEQVIHQSKDPKNNSTVSDSKKENQTAPQKFFTIGLTEMTVILGLMNFLFLSFVIVQIRYFFGGAEHLQQIANLTYADYARRGFFELVWVAALVLPILLIIHWALRKDNPRSEKVFRVLAGGQIVLLFVIMASALQRMFLYQNEYGLTELRVYTTAFMFWLAAVFVIFALTVLIGKRERFTFAAYVSALVMIFALQFANPDYLIARVNIARLNEGKVFDANYVSQLSADAIPTLAANIAQINQNRQCVVKHSLLRRRYNEANSDWRSWNFSRQTAWNLVESNSENWQTECPMSDYNSDLNRDE